VQPTPEDLAVDLELRFVDLERARQKASSTPGLQSAVVSISLEQAAIRRALWAEARLRNLGPSCN